MTTVRIVPARHIRPPRAPDGSDVRDWCPHQRLIVLADDAGHRAVPHSCTAANQSAVLAATVPEPAGSAVLVQAIAAEDYRSRTVTFRGQLRCSPAWPARPGWAAPGREQATGRAG